MSRVKIVSDGTPQGTRVEVDGETVLNVTHVQWSLDASEYGSHAVVTIADVELDLTTEVEW